LSLCYEFLNYIATTYIATTFIKWFLNGNNSYCILSAMLMHYTVNDINKYNNISYSYYYNNTRCFLRQILWRGIFHFPVTIKCFLCTGNSQLKEPVVESSQQCSVGSEQQEKTRVSS